jgi:hypothetical protein
MHIGSGDHLHMTVDGWTSPGNIILVNPCHRTLHRDYIDALKMTTHPSFCKCVLH